MSEQGRRYFNLAGVVRDLEHASGRDATGEGRDLWDRFSVLVLFLAHQAIEEAAEEVDADDGSTDEDGAHDGDEPDVGLPEREMRIGDGAGTGRHPASFDTLLSRIAGLERALAAQHGPESSLPPRTPAVDDTRPGTGCGVKRVSTQEVPLKLNPERTPAVPRGTRRKKGGKKSGTRKTTR